MGYNYYLYFNIAHNNFQNYVICKWIDKKTNNHNSRSGNFFELRLEFETKLLLFFVFALMGIKQHFFRPKQNVDK